MEIRRQAPTVPHLLSATVRGVALLPQAAAGEERPGMARLEDVVDVSAETSRRPPSTRRPAGRQLDVPWALLAAPMEEGTLAAEA